ncbi:MAG: serine/threonine-protein kinase [Anaeromyxobacter sp.]
MLKPIPYGRWLLLERIAVGGMAEVFLAVEQGDPSGRLYALKRILPTLGEDGEFITMFLDEARLVAQLSHPAILPVHELGKQGTGYYIAMDYVAGRDLRTVLERSRARAEPLPVPLAAYIALRVADALDHAHRKRDAGGVDLRIVHRDVSPANILLGYDGSVRVIDFGIAQAALRTHKQDTALRGKFGYMSPEMVRGLPVDRRSDVFALGVVLHEMLTGERLFTGRSELATLERVRSVEVLPPSRRRPEVPAGLDAVVLRALAREPEGRFPWAGELAQALAPFAAVGPEPLEPPALARHMARTFPAEIRAELDRLERLGGETFRAAAEAGLEAAQERTQVVAFSREALLPGLEGLLPAAVRETFRAPPRQASRRTALLALVAAVGVVALSAVLGAARQPAERPAARSGPPAVAAGGRGDPRKQGAPGMLVIQAESAAVLRVDGVERAPALAAGERRVLTVAPGGHRVELRTRDGRQVAATVEVSAGGVAELSGIVLQ